MVDLVFGHKLISARSGVLHLCVQINSKVIFIVKIVNGKHSHQDIGSIYIIAHKMHKGPFGV